MVEWIVPVTDAVVTLLLLLIGGNLGSFLNVVVHRLPRGESVVVGGSRCPACSAPIRWHDNVPVIGWLLLRGRCRDCRAPISPRYPLVEAVGAVVLGGVAAVELLSGGATLPGPEWVGGRSGADNLLLRPDPRLIGMAAFHAWVLFQLLAEAAIEADGDALPARVRVAALVSTLALVTLAPPLSPVGVIPGTWGATSGASRFSTWSRGLLVGAVGASCGNVLGMRGSAGFRAGMTLVGAALGWQATIGVLVLVAIWGCLRKLLVSLLPPSDTARSGVVPAPEAVTLGTESPAEGAGVEGAGEQEDRGGGTPSGASDQGRGVLLDAFVRFGAGSRARSADLVLATATFILLWRRWASLWP